MPKLNTDDNVYTSKENKLIKKLKTWVYLGPLFGILFGVFGYIYFDSKVTPPATVIEAEVGTELISGILMDGDIAHPANGMFTIVATDGGMRSINFSEDFAIVNAPDPHVRINNVVIAKVVNVEGAQSYPIPNFIKEDIMSVHIWCEVADIALGTGVFDSMPIVEVEVKLPAPTNN